MGMGHQSANMHVDCRLRALGYVGRLDIVASQKTQEKLAQLVQSLRIFPGAVQAITPAEAAQSACEVGLFGGLGNWSAGKAMLNTRSCLIMQPLQWTGKRVIDGPRGPQFLKADKYAAFRYDAVPTTDIDTLIEQNIATHAGKLTLRRLVHQVQSGCIELMMVYGLHHVNRSRAAVAALQPCPFAPRRQQASTFSGEPL